MTVVEKVRALVAPYGTEAGRLAFRALLGLSAATVVAHASAIGVLLVVARALAPAEFGMLTAALAAQAYLVMLGSLGCGSVVIREVVRRPGNVDALVTAFLAVTATSAVLACGIALGAVALAPVSSNERWLLSLFALASVPTAMATQPLFDAHHRQARGALMTAAAEVLVLVAVVVSWAGGVLTLPLVAGVYATKWTVASAAQLLAYHLTVRPVRWRWSPPDIALLVRTSWPLLFASMLFFVPLSAGVILVRWRAGAGAAALFGLAYQVASAYQILGALVVQVVQPHVYGVYGLHRAFLARLASFAAFFLGTLGLLAFAGAWLTVLLVLPPFYLEALWAMPWLLATAALLTIARLLSAYLLRLGQERFIMGAHLATALLYVAACVAVPAAWVETGAAVVAPCAALLGVVACWWRVRSRLGEAPAP